MVNINLRSIVVAILGMIATVQVCAFSVFSSQSDDRLMTEKEKYEVLDSVCAALGMSRSEERRECLYMMVISSLLNLRMSTTCRSERYWPTRL